MALSKQAKEMLLADQIKKAEVYAAPYRPLATELAVNVAEAQRIADEAKENRASTWTLFKKALAIATTSKHSVEAMRIGLEIACDGAGIPGGSFRSYVMTVTNLYDDIRQKNITLADAEAMTITQARALYRVLTPLQEARAALNEAIAAWDAAELMKLVDLAKGEAPPEEVEEIIHVAETHAAEAEEARKAA